MSLLSVVVPVYNEEETIEHLMTAVQSVLDAEGISFEMIFVDDGSTDGTYEKIVNLSRSEINIRGYRFSRNFGKESAVWAGLEKAEGDCVVVMDCDLQHPPETLPEFYRLWEQGYEVVEGIKTSRGKESVIKKFLSGVFYGIITFLSGLDMRASSDFKLLDKSVVKELLRFRERDAFFRGLSYWVGFSRAKVEYVVAPRRFGSTKWGFFGLVKYAVNNIAGFSTAPLQLITVAGLILTVLFAGVAVQTLVRFVNGEAVEGFTTTILLILLVGGGLMTGLGIVGLYIAKIYEEVKARPRFIISGFTERKTGGRKPGNPEADV